MKNNRGVDPVYIKRSTPPPGPRDNGRGSRHHYQRASSSSSSSSSTPEVPPWLLCSSNRRENSATQLTDTSSTSPRGRPRADIVSVFNVIALIGL